MPRQGLRAGTGELPGNVFEILLCKRYRFGTEGFTHSKMPMDLASRLSSKF